MVTLTKEQLNELRELLDTAGNLLFAPIGMLPKGEIRDVAQKSASDWTDRALEFTDMLDELPTQEAH
jgi:hypothetical protein